MRPDDNKLQRMEAVIPLTRGMEAIVDQQDWECLSKCKWYAKWNPVTRSFYAYRQDKKKTTAMHRVIMEATGRVLVDHRNHNTLDNRRENLRVCTSAQNLWNQGKRKKNTSGYKGVSWNRNSKKWIACIGVNRKSIYLGAFPSAHEAGMAYADAARLYHGEFANSGEERRF